MQIEERHIFYDVLLWQCIFLNNKSPSYQSECMYSIWHIPPKFNLKETLKRGRKKKHSEMITWMTFQKITLWLQVKIIFPWIHHNVHCTQSAVKWATNYDVWCAHVLSNGKRIPYEHLRWKRVKSILWMELGCESVRFLQVLNF